MYYEIEGTRVRLAGSLHLLPASAPNLPDWVWRAYDWAEEIIFEADVATVKDHIYLKDGESLQSHLPVPLWNRLVAACPPGRPLEAVSSLKPWMAMIVLPLSQVSTARGVEPQLTDRARQDNKSITYLETMAEFAELADAIPAETLHEALSITLAELANAPQNFMDLHQAWLSRNLEQVETVVARTPFHRMPEIVARVVEMRNERWLPQILAVTFSEKRVLIAPGALHLPGKTGLLALLQRAGHRVRRIS